jgi:hypothetical protein
MDRKSVNSISRKLALKERKMENNTDFAEHINYIRKKFNIPAQLQCYVFKDYTFGKRINKWKFDEIEYNIASINNQNVKVKTKCGIIRKKNFIIVNVNMDECIYHILFTNNIKKFEKEFFKIKYKIGKGIYKIEEINGTITLNKVNINDVQPPILNENIFNEIINEIKLFINKEKIYEEIGIEYKRGYILYGNPGNGKTSLIKYILKNVEGIGIICDATKTYQLEFIEKIITDENIKNELKIIIMEDIEGIDTYARSILLNLLDGITPAYKTIFIATTNFPNKLDIAIRNRPSRFDGIYHIQEPNEKSRKLLTKRFLKNVTKKDIQKIVKMTENMNGAHFKEIYIITKLYQITPVEAIRKMKKRIDVFQEFMMKENYIG